MAEKINLNTGWKLHFDPINNQPETFNEIKISFIYILSKGAVEGIQTLTK